jgi:molybdate transport system ATP-binding protein
MTLSVDVLYRQGSFMLDAAFQSGGRLTALFGASGSGKTTLINIIGGLVRPERGRVVVDDHVLVDTAAGVFVPKHRRRIGYVFQDARLFPHLTVAQNLRYGSFFSPKDERYSDFESLVQMLGIGQLLDRRPAALSGGEKQRVAIGRALNASPRLILMDEPLASLDEARKAEVLPYIERMRDQLRIPIVYVSHSLAEVSRLATDVVRLRDGQVMASGPVQEALAGAGMPDALAKIDQGHGEPFALIELEVVGAEEADGLAILRSDGGEWRLPLGGLRVGAQFRARILASDVLVAREVPRSISALNVVSAVVESVSEPALGTCLVVMRCGSDRLLASITARSARLLQLSSGQPVHAIVKSVAVDRLLIS